jgi:hypothetical protein
VNFPSSVSSIPRHPATPLVAAILSILTGCNTQSYAEWHDEGLYRWHALAVDGRDAVGFTQMSSSKTGLAFMNHVSQEPHLWANYVGHGSGVRE